MTIAPMQTREPYSIGRLQFDSLTNRQLSEWKFIRSRCVAPDPATDPDWLRGYFQGQTDTLSVYMLYHYGVPSGVAVFIMRHWPLDCYLGDFRVLRLPMRRLRLVGMDWPENAIDYDELWVELESADCDTVFLEGVPVESFLWDYALGADDSFRIYAPGELTPRPRIRIEGTFEDYLKRFSARHRHNLRRRVSKFQQDHKGVRWQIYTTPEEVAPFLAHALEVSRMTYQWRLFHRGLADTEILRKRLEFAAGRGEFRSYILFAANQPVAFIAGWQHAGTYDHHEIGYDPAFKKYAPGTVLHMFMIEDLFANNPPRYLDFGAYAKYKEELANEGHLEGKLFLFRRSPYTWLVEQAHRASLGITEGVGAVLERWNLKSRIRGMVRGRA